jgi:O-acetyl-ADP-ribose deacetylase (regulator of RNase III)
MKKVLEISDYANNINLYDDFVTTHLKLSKEKLVDTLLTDLHQEINMQSPYTEKRRLLHAKLNTLPPNTLKQSSIKKLDYLLQLELKDKEITSADSIASESVKTIGKTKVAVWQGDITTLNVDAIVNAANSQMLGCFQPLHACIDNAIHSAAGVQVRDDCDIIMQKQGFEEPTGTAKITRAYNLPSRFVIHTVGPIVRGQVTAQNQVDLANAYVSCLETAKAIDTLRSIAFCGISTGIFGYPIDDAAKIAFTTVTHWLKNNPEALDIVIFDVFSAYEKSIYERLVDR